MQKSHWAVAEWRQKDFESGVGAAPFPTALYFVLFYFPFERNTWHRLLFKPPWAEWNGQREVSQGPKQNQSQSEYNQRHSNFNSLNSHSLGQVAVCFVSIATFAAWAPKAKWLFHICCPLVFLSSFNIWKSSDFLANLRLLCWLFSFDMV